MAARVEILIPEDGGTPRDPARIQRLGENKFLVRAAREEGPNPLDHAVSRVELVLRNPHDSFADVTLAIDVSGDDLATRRDARWGAPEERDYVYVRPPGGHWQRVDGEFHGWEARVALRLPPGDTLLGLSPHYSYADYLRFVNSLPTGPLLSKVLLGHSDDGREHWALRISDPRGPAEKKLRCLLVARAHAYETFGSFAIEGMVRYLLSSPPGANLPSFDIEIWPMLNVDGVARGYEYSQGFEQGSERNLTACVSGRLYLARIDDWQPHVLVTLHNWITPRALDVISYTDVDDAGRRIDRAQEIFRGFFPPQTEFGKAWLNDVDEPLSHNWAREEQKERPDLTNPEVYARVRYRTEIWVPELPWFGRDDDDPAEIARDTGRQYLRALLQTLARIHALPNAVLEPSLQMSFLSERQPSRVEPPSMQIGSGALISGSSLILNRVAFSHGLMLPAETRVTYRLDGEWETFAAVTGICKSISSRTIVEFQVDGDGRRLWTSEECHPESRRERIAIDVRGIQELTLSSRTLSGPQGSTTLAWADAKLGCHLGSEMPARGGETPLALRARRACG